jgi:hypothetical protein
MKSYHFDHNVQKCLESTSRATLTALFLFLVMSNFKTCSHVIVSIGWVSCKKTHDDEWFLCSSLKTK